MTGKRAGTRPVHSAVELPAESSVLEIFAIGERLAKTCWQLIQGINGGRVD